MFTTANPCSAVSGACAGRQQQQQRASREVQSCQCVKDVFSPVLHKKGIKMDSHKGSKQVTYDGESTTAITVQTNQQLTAVVDYSGVMSMSNLQ